MSEEKFSKKGFGLKIAVVVFVLLFTAGGFVLGMEYQKRQSAEDKQQMADNVDDILNNEDLNNNDQDVDLPVVTTYEGQVISADLPDGWTIVEYFDGEGSDTLVEESVYSGLTGLEILKDDNVMFSLKGVSGIGGIFACSELSVFSDTAQTYIDEIVDEAGEAGIITSVEDLSNEVISEFELLGTKMRRYERRYYWDMNMATTAFDTNCGLNGSAFPLNGLNFYSDLGSVTETEIDTYWYSVAETASADELEFVDGILESLELL